ncbi:hypothetical protein ACFXGI_06145 [Streptomyces sp. NPDC059355]|uniref:hypothetical protein n=1 Tax=Streptomyces sp. NPDC059355 TaxID=3346811 RepID=UPI0036BD353D
MTDAEFAWMLSAWAVPDARATAMAAARRRPAEAARRARRGPRAHRGPLVARRRTGAGARPAVARPASVLDGLAGGRTPREEVAWLLRIAAHYRTLTADACPADSDSGAGAPAAAGPA